MLPSMDDNELNELFRRREACLRDGIPREVYVEAVERAHELRRTAFAAAFQAFLRALSGGTHTDPSGDDSMIVREWRGWAALSKADDYPKHFRDRVIPELCRLDGFVGCSSPDAALATGSSSSRLPAGRQWMRSAASRDRTLQRQLWTLRALPSLLNSTRPCSTTRWSKRPSPHRQRGEQAVRGTDG